MTFRLYYILCVMLILLSLGCATKQSRLKATESANTNNGQEKLFGNVSREYANDPQSKLQALRNIKTVWILSDVSYTRAVKYKLPLLKICKEIFSYADIEVKTKPVLGTAQEKRFKEIIKKIENLEEKLEFLNSRFYQIVYNVPFGISLYYIRDLHSTAKVIGWGAIFAGVLYDTFWLWEVIQHKNIEVRIARLHEDLLKILQQNYKGENYDAALIINIRGISHSKQYYKYKSDPGTLHYSGAHIVGRLYFPKFGWKVYKFSGIVLTPFFIYKHYLTPDAAPYKEALDKSSFREKLFEILDLIKGPLPLIAALNDENWRIREAAANALGRLKDKRAVEALSTTLNDENQVVREAAAKALKKIVK